MRLLCLLLLLLFVCSLSVCFSISKYAYMNYGRSEIGRLNMAETENVIQLLLISNSFVILYCSTKKVIFGTVNVTWIIHVTSD